jgi:RNA polymerase sigma-70 factor (ECF subfamily)
MPEAPTTQPSLLVRLRDARDERAWGQFVDLYAPLVYGHARRHGLQDADAADLTQVVLRAVACAISRFEYNPERGSFRGWLFTIVRGKLATFLGRRDWFQGSGDSATRRLLEDQAAPSVDSAVWDVEYEQRLFAWAAEQVRSQVREATWQAFWQTAVEGKPGKEVAAKLGLTLPAVRLAKSRVLARLRSLIEQVRDDRSPPPDHRLQARRGQP